MTNNKLVKLNVADLLKSRKINQSELARLSGIRRATIHMYCHQTAAYIQLSHIPALCRVLRCEIDDLFQLVDPDELPKNSPQRKGLI